MFGRPLLGHNSYRRLTIAIALSRRPDCKERLFHRRNTILYVDFSKHYPVESHDLMRPRWSSFGLYSQGIRDVEEIHSKLSKLTNSLSSGWRPLESFDRAPPRQPEHPESGILQVPSSAKFHGCLTRSASAPQESLVHASPVPR